MILIFGGAFLAYEGAHKVHERLTGHATEAEEEVAPNGELTPEHEERTISQAIRTDFILSAEIMVIALKEVVSSDPDASIWMRAIVLAVVAILITVLVYGVVALIVKMDDVGLHLAEKPSKGSQRVGLALVSAMPRLLAAISFIGTLAMLWVGGHIFLVSLYEIGGHDGLLEGTALGDVLHAPYDLVHHWEDDVHDAIGGALGALAGWLLNTLLSALVGLVVGGIILAVLRVVGVGGPRRGPRGGARCGRRCGRRCSRGRALGRARRRALRRTLGRAVRRPRWRLPRILRIAERGPTLLWSAREIPTMHRCAAQTRLLRHQETHDGLQGR